MKFGLKVMLPAIVLTLLTAGCYTKFYRPGMEQGSGPFGQIYNRYDSSAIDTTLTKPEYQGYTTYYPEYQIYDDWYDWGRPRHQRTRWGFDFYNFSPDYYWSYYGYYDYYGTPWWRSWYDPYYWRYPYWGHSAEPVEPPSKRPGDRGRFDGGGSSYSAPSVSGSSGGSYANPPAAPPPSSPAPAAKQQTTNATKQQPQQSSGDSNKREGGRGR